MLVRALTTASEAMTHHGIGQQLVKALELVLWDGDRPLEFLKADCREGPGALPATNGSFLNPTPPQVQSPQR